MTELVDYSGGFDPAFSQEKLRKETLLKLLRAYNDYMLRIDGYWYLTVMNKWGNKVYIVAADYNYGQITAQWMQKFVADNGGETLGGLLSGLPGFDGSPGTYGGLVRFDGVRFSVFDSDRFPGLVDSRVTALFEDARGTLWIGHETGNVTRFERGALEPVALPAALRRTEILDIAADRAGQVL